jgi:integrase
MPKVNLTKSAVDKIHFPNAGQVLFYDETLKGFGLRVGKQAKAYFAERRVQGRTVRVTIGPHGPITCDQARKKAQRILGEMVGGSNPNTQKKAERDKGVTLQSAFEDFLKTRSLKDRTVQDYRRAMEIALSDWKAKRIIDITRDMVASRHRKLGDKIGKAQANQVMRFLRSLMNYCAGAYEDSKGEPLVKFNPVARLSQTGQWFRVPRRQTEIKKHEFPKWYKAVGEIQSDMVRDYLHLLLFSGLRKSEGLNLKKDDIDLKDKTFVIQDPKNSKPLILPLPKYLFKIIEARIKRKNESEYIFPGSGGTGHLVEPKKSIAKVIEKSKVQFCLHDLRRFFITTAESLDISSFAIKRLVNHAIDAGNVTDGYVTHDVDRLRKPMQQIEDRILKLAKASEPAKIVQLNVN